MMDDGASRFKSGLLENESCEAAGYLLDINTGTHRLQDHEVGDKVNTAETLNNLADNLVCSVDTSLEIKKLDRIAGYLETSNRWNKILGSKGSSKVCILLTVFASGLSIIAAGWVIAFMWMHPSVPPTPPCEFRQDTVVADITVHFRNRYFGGCTFGPIHGLSGITDSINGNIGNDPGTGIYGMCENTTVLVTRDYSVPPDFTIYSISNSPWDLPARESGEYRLLLSEEAAVRFTRMLQPKYIKQFDGWIGYNDAAEVFFERTHADVVSKFFSLDMIPFEEKEFGLYYAHSNCNGFNGRNEYIRALRNAGLPV